MTPMGREVTAWSACALARRAHLSREQKGVVKKEMAVHPRTRCPQSESSDLEWVTLHF